MRRETQRGKFGNPMKISVVTCTWNSDVYLWSAVNSVLNQGYRDFEFVFVDGGSTDQTLQIIESVSAEKIILNNVSGGIAKAMNAGTEAASGDLVIHLHSDDYLLHGNVFARVVEMFQVTQCDWLFGRILNDRAGGLFPETYWADDYSYSNLLKSNFVPHAATFVKRALYEKAGGFNSNFRFAMDYDMWLRLGKLANPIQLREALSVFRRHDGSTTERNRLGSFDEDYSVRRRYLGASLPLRLEHYLRYQVRRKRLIRSLA